MKKLPLIIAEKLNKSLGSTYILMPAKGWSEGDREGMPFFDLATDRIFTKNLKKLFNSNIPFEEMNIHLNDPLFAQRAVEVLDTMIQNK